MFLLVIITLLLTSSCLSVKESEPVEEKARYVETDIADVSDAKATIEANKDKRIELINKGAERAERFEPLILSLIAFHEFDQEITLADVSPFIKELPHIASISNYIEKEEFIRLGTADGISTKKVISEAEKGEEANKYVKKLKAENAELKADIKSRITEKTVLIGASFMTIGGIVFAASFFITAMAKRLMFGGGSIIAVGGCIMAFGSFIDSFRNFMDTNGNKVFWLLLIPLLGLVWLMFIRKADKAIDEIKDN